MEITEEGINHKHKTQYTIVAVYQMVLLFGDEGEFINIWHKSNVARCEPGTLDMHEGMRRK